VLTQAGHRVEGVADGPSGLARLARAPRVDVVVLDVRLPGLDGLAVLELIGSEGPPVVLVTADPTALKAGAKWTLAKPYRPEELVTAVAAAMGRGPGGTEP
jgi:two-component system, OmpR family, response regulator